MLSVDDIHMWWPNCEESSKYETSQGRAYSPGVPGFLWPLYWHTVYLLVTRMAVLYGSGCLHFKNVVWWEALHWWKARGHGPLKSGTVYFLYEILKHIHRTPIRFKTSNSKALCKQSNVAVELMCYATDRERCRRASHMLLQGSERFWPHI